MQTIAKTTFGPLLFLAAISLVTLFFRLGSLPFMGNDEPRYARIAEEMYQRGDWITPTLQNEPWLEKPPLYYWTTIPFYSMFANKETAARFAPAVSAFLTALAIFWLGSTLWNRLAGLIGASALLTGIGIVGGRIAATDMPFTCCLTLGLAILASAVKKDPGALRTLTAYIFLGLAVLGKGPVAVILAAGTGLAYWYLNEQNHILSRWRIIRGSIILLLVCAPWFWLAFKENGYSFISTFIVNHNIARYVTEIHHHHQAFYYFIPVLLLIFFPWSGWLPLLFRKSPLQTIRNWRNWDRGFLFLTCWFIFPVLFFSLSNSKLAGYILPSLPPLALMLGVRMSQWIQSQSRPPALKASVILSLAFSFALAAGAPIYFGVECGGNWETGLSLSPALIIPTLITAFFALRGGISKAVITTVIQGMLIIFSLVQFGGPVLADYLSSKGIAEIILEERLAGEPVVTYGITLHPLDYYTGYRTSGKVEDPASLRNLLHDNNPILVVTRQSKMREFERLPGCSIEILGEQGNLRLLRLQRE